MKFNFDTSYFIFDFMVDTSIDAPSVGFFSETFFYENGMSHGLADSDSNVLTSPDDYTWEFKDSYLTFKIVNSDYDGKLLSLIVQKT